MKIINFLKIREKYPNTLVRKIDDINEIVIHGTGGFSTAKGIFDWMLSGERDADYKKNIALFHYLIDLEGAIYKVYEYENWFYHSSSGKHDKTTIGIEFLNPSKQNSKEYTNKQYESILSLLFEKLLKNLKITSIVGHSKNAEIFSNHYKDTPICPGKQFRWDIIENELLSRKYSFKNDSEKIFNLKLNEV